MFLCQNSNIDLVFVIGWGWGQAGLTGLSLVFISGKRRCKKTIIGFETSKPFGWWNLYLGTGMCNPKVKYLLKARGKSLKASQN